ncbi:MAG TPA: NAD+ synthase, partial [Chloroflexi bacterium]|nr:NAD+ synthase [Chloroflexota bacterium]
DILVDFIRTEIRRAGFERAVVGVSGGLDSSVTLLLTAQAMGPEQVLALSMPYRTSSQDSREHARLIAQQAGVHLEEVDISPMADAFFERFPDADRVRRGNVMARMRMIVLFDQSAAFKGLVVGTGNKTELLLGYTTLYGDSACALNPLGDLYKTQVRQLARFLEVPEEILNKPPSADLWDGQTDEGELGFTYEQVDRLLYLLVDQRYSPDDCVEAGFEHGFVEKVLDRIRRNQFKRLLPPIAKLSNRTVGYDFLYLRDWGT